ncbi:MAG: cobyric acid synthase, partial [Gammaproteobacteria bacterium]|nr:cobyric acid synthase [Gammaproteobacteria bacterium]
MFQGTGSDVGKSLLVAGLARAYTRRGLRVQPFKPQNMSNNAAVTDDGGEIGRAQALQARACGLAPSVHMNPVLLKPQSEVGAQVVVHGRVVGNARARDYQAMKATLMPRVMESFEQLSEHADLVLVEGAGSAAEMNLRVSDIANMGFACAADVPVVLVADIDRGGVLASIVGTHALLPENERALIAGYLVNKFRGDASLFDGAIDIIGARTGLECLGVVPWFHRASQLPAEDAMSIEGSGTVHGGGHTGRHGTIRVVVPCLSRIANFDDLDPLIAEPDVRVSFVQAGDPLPADADLVVLPGSKSTIADLDFLRAQGWDIDLAAHVRRGGWVLGICAGFQMLGHSVRDPAGIEGEAAERTGLNLLDIDTYIGERKQLRACTASDALSDEALSGYEMHMGMTSGNGLARRMLSVDGASHGAVSRSGRVMGCYIHGLFTADGFRHAFLSRLRSRANSGVAYESG